jgi:Phage integrase, N-terminal SAM-like domain
MPRNAISPPSEKTTAKKYPIKHKRPTGQIIQRGPKQFMVWLHSHTDAEGKPVRYTKTFRTLKEADAHLTEKVAEKNRRRFRAETGERLSELIERYMRQEASEKMRPHTLAVRHYYMRRYVYPTLGHFKARDITHEDVRGLYNKLQGTTSERTGRKLAKGTVRLVHQTLRAILSFYV